MFTIPFSYWAGESALPLQNVLVTGNGSTTPLTFNGVTVNRGILKMNSNGVVDTTFNSGGIGVSNASTIIAAIPQSTGKIVIYYSGNGGTPRYVSNGVTYNLNSTSLARLNANGTWDTTFQSPIPGRAQVNQSNANYGNNKTLIVLDDDSIVVINEVALYVEKYPPNGALQPTNSATFNNNISNIRKTPDGKIFAIGNFSTVNSVVMNKMARLNSDLSIDTSFVTGTGLNNSGWNVEIQSDGKAIIGGIYTTVNGTARSFVNRQYIDGAMSGVFDTGYVPTISASPATYIYSTSSRTAMQSDGKLLSTNGLASGSFTYNGSGMASSMIYRVNTDGNIDSSFLRSVPNGRLFSFAQLNDGKILVGSLATNITGYAGGPSGAVSNFYRLNADGTLDTTFAMTGTSSWVRNITIL